MNANDRKKAQQLAEELAALFLKLEDIKSEIETLQEAEQEKFDNMSEGLQQSEKGQKIEEAANALSDIVSNVESALVEIEGAKDALEGIE